MRYCLTFYRILFEFFRILSDSLSPFIFSSFYRILPDFLLSSRNLVDFPRIFQDSVRFFWILLEYYGFYNSLLNSYGFFRTLSVSFGFSNILSDSCGTYRCLWIFLDSFGFFRILSSPLGISLDSLTFSCIPSDSVGFSGILLHSLRLYLMVSHSIRS